MQSGVTFACRANKTAHHLLIPLVIPNLCSVAILSSGTIFTLNDLFGRCTPMRLLTVTRLDLRHLATPFISPNNHPPHFSSMLYLENPITFSLRAIRILNNRQQDALALYLPDNTSETSTSKILAPTSPTATSFATHHRFPRAY